MKLNCAAIQERLGANETMNEHLLRVDFGIYYGHSALAKNPLNRVGGSHDVAVNDHPRTGTTVP